MTGEKMPLSVQEELRRRVQARRQSKAREAILSYLGMFSDDHDLVASVTESVMQAIDEATYRVDA